MSAPALAKFPKLIVEITQREDVPNLRARVVQGSWLGDDLFADVFPPVRRLDRAHDLVHSKLDAFAENIEFIDPRSQKASS
jgi:hypothetical protein